MQAEIEEYRRTDSLFGGDTWDVVEPGALCVGPGSTVGFASEVEGL